jgi:hypothetical protein
MALTAAILANNFPQVIGLKSQIRALKSPVSQADIMRKQLEIKLHLRNN